MKKVTLYSGDPCPFCSAAKALLKTKDVEIEEFDIWKDPAKAKEMLQKTNGLTRGSRPNYEMRHCRSTPEKK